MRIQIHTLSNSLVLLQLPKFRSLRHLDLGGHDGLGPHCQQLASALMELSGAAATGAQARSEERQPMSSPRPRLRRLELAGCRIGTDGCYHLTRALEAGAGRSLTGKEGRKEGKMMARKRGAPGHHPTQPTYLS